MAKRPQKRSLADSAGTWPMDDAEADEMLRETYRLRDETMARPVPRVSAHEPVED